MAWQDPADPNNRLKLKIRPLIRLGFILRAWIVLLGVAGVLSGGAALVALLNGAPAADTGLFFMVAMGCGGLLAFFVLILRIQRFWKTFRE